jgi:hypothetical protein
MKNLCQMLMILVALVVSTFAEAACGDRGGPGYRGPDGKCLSWQDLGRKCGSPPTTNCTPENVAREADRGAQGGVEIEGMKKRQHHATQSRR